MAIFASGFGVNSKFVYLMTFTCVLFSSECYVSVFNSNDLGVGLHSDDMNIVFEVTNVDSADNVISSRIDTRMAYVQTIEYIYEDNVWSDLFSYVQDIDKFINLTSYRFTALSFLFPLNHLTNVQKALNAKSVENLIVYNELKINSLILFVRESRDDEPSDCFWRNHHFPDLQLNNLASIKQHSQKLNTSLNLGLEYLSSLIKYCRDDNFEILSLVNFTVLKITYTPQDDLFTYGLFAENLNDVLPRNREFVRNYNSNCTLYIRIIFIDEKAKSDEINNRYKALLAEYIATWTKENVHEEIFIVEVHPLNVKLSSNLDVLKSQVYTQFSGIFDHSKSLDVTGCEENTSLCENRQMISIISQTFRRLQFSTEQVICSKLTESCFDYDLTNKTFLKNSTTYLFENYEDTSTGNQQIVEKLAENGQYLNLRTIYFSNPNSSWNTQAWNQTFSLLHRKNINIGGYVQIIEDGKFSGEEDPIGEAFSKIGQLFFQATEILMHIRIDLDLQDTLPKLLFDLQSAQQLYNKYFYKSNFVIAVTLESNPSGFDPPEDGFVSGFRNQPTTVKGSLSLYCDKFAKRINELYEAVLTHANIHNWKNFHLRNAVSKDEPGSWWLSVDTKPEYVDRRITNYPLLVRTNAAKPLHKNQQLPMTFPCIEWTTKSVESGIRFLDNGFIGATVSMAIRKDPLNPTELETMLLYALGKFGSAELLVKSKQDLDNVAAVVLNERFTNISLRQNGPLIYIDLPVEMAFENNILNYSSDKVFWHFSDWESYKRSNVSKHGSQIGLSVENCGHEINTNFTKLKNLSILSEISYLICHTKPFLPNNRNPTYMAEYLHTLYYIKHYIETFLPKQVKMLQNFKVHFRLNFNSEQNCQNIGRKDRIENFLRFLNDVNQHSSAYKINYFIEAFENQNKTYKCSNSWWHLKNYENLTNVSVYIDKEEEHFGRPTKLVLQLPPLPSLENVQIQQNVTQTIIFSVVSILFIFALAILFLRWWQTRQRYLDDKEMKLFYNGNPDTESTHGSKWLGIPFPKNFEIPLSNIELGQLIGSGEFGKVYHGKLNEHLDVAIKVPNPNDSKESFKNALTEVKTLCYLANGQHSNIVLFLGAYTREIQNGKLYILTEFCAIGSLQNYLRSSLREYIDGTNQSVELYKLYNFAYEIASGMEYISAKRVIHGDLAARNIFLNGDLTCKIGDFGLSRKLYEFNEYVKKSQEPLPWRWMAIESLKHMEFTTKSDVWSFGVTVWEIFSFGDIPFPGLSWNAGFVNELEKGLRMKKARYASEDIHLTLMKCWDSALDNRPSFAELAEFFSSKKITEYEPL